MLQQIGRAGDLCDEIRQFAGRKAKFVCYPADFIVRAIGKFSRARGPAPPPRPGVLGNATAQ
jgi:hypothetical protein